MSGQRDPVQEGLGLASNAATLSGLTGAYTGAEAGAAAASAAAEGAGAGAGAGVAGLSSILGPIGVLGAFYEIVSTLGSLAQDTQGQLQRDIHTTERLADEASVPVQNLGPLQNELGAAVEGGSDVMYGLKQDLSNIGSVLPHYQDKVAYGPASYGGAGDAALYALLAENNALNLQQVANNPKSFYLPADYVPGNVGQLGDFESEINIPVGEQAAPPYLNDFWNQYQAGQINPQSFQSGRWGDWLSQYNAQYGGNSGSTDSTSTAAGATSAAAGPPSSPAAKPAANPSQGSGSATPSNIAALKDPSLIATLKNYGLNT